MKFLPERRPITAFGDGGFRFGNLSHRGHLLVLPSGMRAWDGLSFEALINEMNEVDLFLYGSGARLSRLEAGMTASLNSHKIAHETMTTSAAIHTYNYMLSEGRRVAAALLAVP